MTDVATQDSDWHMSPTFDEYGAADALHPEGGQRLIPHLFRIRGGSSPRSAQTTTR